jgi:hypothetical protein
LESGGLGYLQVLGQVVLLDCANGNKEKVVRGRESRMTGGYSIEKHKGVACYPAGVEIMTTTRFSIDSHSSSLSSAAWSELAAAVLLLLLLLLLLLVVLVVVVLVVLVVMPVV